MTVYRRSDRRLSRSERRRHEFRLLAVRAAIEAAVRAMYSRRPSHREHINTGARRTRFDFSAHADTLTDRQFKRLYRVSKSEFDDLMPVLFPAHDPAPIRLHNRRAIDPRIRLAVFMRVLAGAQTLDLFWPYHIGQSSVYNVFTDVLRRVATHLDSVKFPRSRSECKKAADDFQRLRESPIWGVVSALDGISIAIKCPTLVDTPSPRSYYNRKGFYSVCVQAACAADYGFTFFNASNCGSTHDSTAFSASGLHTLLSKAPEEPGGLPSFAVVAADDAYGNGSCWGRIMTPKSGSGLSAEMDVFNYFWSSLRTIIEQTFGILVARWGILWSPLRYSLVTNILIIEACIKLHNYIIARRRARDESSVSAEALLTDMEGIDEDNNVSGSAQIFMQHLHHTEDDLSRNRRNFCGAKREEVAKKLYELGHRRPGRANR